MFNHKFTFENLSTLTDKYVEKVLYGEDNRLNISLKPEKNFKKSDLYEGFLNLTWITLRLRDELQKMLSANELRTDEEKHHTTPWTEEIQKTVKNASSNIETKLAYVIT